MKKIMIASGLLALMGAATSCDKYDIYPEQYGDVLMIKDGGEKEVTIYATDDAAEYGVTVMKGGHTPGDPANAELRVMNDNDLKQYKEKIYGDPNFAGLEPLNPEFYVILDHNGQEVPTGSVKHDFNAENDRYFNAKILLNAQKISDWRMALEETEEGKLLLNSKKFVIPMGLYSTTDSVNADNFYLMLEPVVTDPVATITVEHNGYDLTQVSRTKLVDQPGFRDMPVEPEVYIEVPCKNPYGFAIKYKTGSSLVRTFNEANTTVQLTDIKNPGKNELDYNDPDKWNFKQGYYDEATDTYEDKIYFAPGVTKVRVPLTINTKNIDANNLTANLVKAFQFSPATSAKVGVDMLWGEEAGAGALTDVPDKVKKSLKLPTDPENAKNPYTFFVGYKVVETPLELNDGCVTSNDCEPTEGSIAALFDDNLSTFFHSGWTVAFERSAPFASYLEIEVPANNPVNACYFQFTSRVHSNPMSPKSVHLYYSNEDDPDNRMLEAAWTKFAEVSLKKKLGSGETGELGSLDKMATAPETFKYLRFCVMTNANDQSLTAPSTSVYWNLAELRMYGKYIDPSATPDTPAE